MKTTVLIAALALGVGISSSQSLPPSARHALNERFLHWTFRPNHIPSLCDHPGSAGPSFKPISKCNFNGDGIPDYMVAITTGRDSNLVEYFVALISNGKRYDLNLLDSARVYHGAGERIFTVIPAGDTMAVFGDDTLVYNYGTSLGHDGITFPTDVIEIDSECGGYYKPVEAMGFVFVRGRLRAFSAAD